MGARAHGWSDLTVRLSRALPVLRPEAEGKEHRLQLTYTQIKEQLIRTICDFLITWGVLFCTAFICAFMHDVYPADAYAPVLFILAVMIVARLSHGYLWGLVASLVSVLIVNYTFCYPYFTFGLSGRGNILSYICFLVAALICGSMTTTLKTQEKARAEAAQEKMCSNLLRSVSHDLRTPLTSIIGSIAVLSENADLFSPAEQHRLLSEADADARRLIRMFENMLSITRMNTDQLQIIRSDEALEEIIAQAVHKLKKHYPEIKVEIQIPEELIIAPVDGILIEQVLANLLENAVVHGDTDRIAIMLRKQGDMAEICVRDFGSGLTDFATKHLFDDYAWHYMQDSGEGKRHMQIGLSLCKTIVDAHNGRLYAKNCRDGGAKFYFTLPLQEKGALYGR